MLTERAAGPAPAEAFTAWLPGVRSWAAAARPTRADWAAGAGLGLLSLSVPTGSGGAGAGYLATCRAWEAAGEAAVLAGADEPGGLLFGMAAHLWACQEPLLAFGTPGQHAALLPGMLTGSVVGAFAATEDGAGSDVFSMRTRAERDDAGRWRLDGAKAFVTNAPFADVFLVLARTGAGSALGALSAFLVPRGTAGLTVGPALAQVGPAGAAMAPVQFDGVRVGPDACLGGEGAGFAVLMHAMRHERAMILAPAVGLMAGALARAVEHARHRVQFGRPIGAFDSVRERLVDAELSVTTAREVLHGTARLADLGELTHRRAALTKLHVSREFGRLGRRLADLYGGYAVLPSTGIAQLLQDALASRFYSGTEDMQVKVIAEGWGL